MSLALCIFDKPVLCYIPFFFNFHVLFYFFPSKHVPQAFTAMKIKTTASEVHYFTIMNA